MCVFTASTDPLLLLSASTKGLLNIAYQVNTEIQGFTSKMPNCGLII